MDFYQPPKPAIIRAVDLPRSLADQRGIQFVKGYADKHGISFDEAAQIIFVRKRKARTYEYLRLRETANVGGLTNLILYSLQYSNDGGTTWFPTSNMTGNSAPSPLVASADSEFSGSFQAYLAFDGNAGTRYTSASSAHPHYLQIYLGAGNGILPNRVRYGIFNSGGDYTPKDFTILGSNTGSFSGEETTLLTVTGASSGGADGTVVTRTI